MAAVLLGWSFVLLAAHAPASAAGEELLALCSVHGAADPLALAVASDEARVFVAEGAEVVELALPSAGELSRTPVDAGILQLHCTEERLWIAGGSHGLWSIEIAGDARVAKLVDRPEGLYCLALTAAGSRVFASYGAHAGPELRVYDAASGALRERVALPPGMPHAVAARGADVYVALGDGGLCAVTLRAGDEALVTRGPELSGLAVPDGFQLAAGHARDLACDGDELFVAADASGLVAIDVAKGLRPDSALRVVPLPEWDGPLYAARVTARAGALALGLNAGPARFADGAPWSSTGTMGWDLGMGGLSPEMAPFGRSGATLLFAREGGRLRLEGSARHTTSAWRAIALGKEHIYELHMRHGLAVRERRELAQVSARRRGRGIPAVRPATSLLDPSLVLFGMDSQGALARGLLRIEAGERLAPVPGTEEQRSLGLSPGASWRGAEPGVEWMLGDHGFGWSLHRIEHAAPPRIASWRLPGPADPDGARGSSYFFATRDGERALLTSAGTRYGFALLRTAELEAKARAAAPGEPLSLESWSFVATHGADEEPPHLTFGAASFRAGDGRTLAAVAAGSYGGELDGVDRPARLVVVALEGEGAPRAIGAAHAPLPRGQAIAVATARLAGCTYAFVADLAGRLSVFDLARPEAPRHALDWISPPSAFDGEPDVALDVAVLVDDEERSALVLLAAGRRGIVCLTVGGEPLALTDHGAVDTPGWAAGLCLERYASGTRLLAGDQKGGVRLYSVRWPAPRESSRER